jgi:predicted DCC family thiol-disulfide oxidoreductase YuxK
MPQIFAQKFQSAASIAEKFVDVEFAPSTKKLFRIALFAWFLLTTLLMLPSHTEFWSAQAFISRISPAPGSIRMFSAILSHPLVTPYYLLFVFGAIFSYTLAMLGVQTRLMTFFSIFFAYNLANQAEITLDGGDNLSWLMLSYLLFMNTDGRKVAKKSWSGWLSTGISNAAFILACFQVLVVYFYAGICKIDGELWQKGMALFYILQSSNYGHPAIAPLLLKAWPLTVIGTYFTMGFQLLFSFYVWNKKAKPYLFAAGTFLHFNIGLVMGLPSFGLIMCLVYILFFPEDWSHAVLNWFSPKSKLIVAYDEMCVICQKFAHFVGKYDSKNLLVRSGARMSEGEYFKETTLEDRLIRIHACEADSEKVFTGYAVISEIIVRLPGGFLLRPFLFTLGFIGVGDYLYNKVATSQVRSNCSNQGCELKI